MIVGTQQSISRTLPSHLHIVDEAFAEAAARKLLFFIGPIAGVVAKRSLRLTQDKAEFLRLLAEQISSLPERNRFLVEANNI